MEEQALLQEQINYYRARAAEYDEWFFRHGRYDHGTEHRTAWLGEVAVVEAGLKATLPRGDGLEIACGTGLWTRRLVESHQRVVAVGGSPEVIAINREGGQSDSVEHIGGELF